jgi:8-oxo-dGTP diphosphatase
MDQFPVMRYTLCFLTRECSNEIRAQDGCVDDDGDWYTCQEVLMLHRRYPPNQGLWNGVGGRLEPGESPRSCILREVYEETGYRLTRVSFRGILTWDGFETPSGGLYIFTADAPERENQPAAWECPEGLLMW